MPYVEKKRWVFFGLPLTFTTYTIDDEQVTIDSGLLRRVQNDCYLYKIQDTVLIRSLFERIFGLGTVECHTGDATHPTLLLEHIKNSLEIKNYIAQASEEARLRRRTLNTLDIGVDGDLSDL